MKTFIPVYMMLAFLFNTNILAQCKFKTKIPNDKYAVTETCNKSIDAATKMKPLFSKFSNAASSCMAKSGQNFYFCFFMTRTYASRFELLRDNSIDLYFMNGEKLSLFPCGDFAGKYMGLSLTYTIGCYYNIDREQLSKIAKNQIQRIAIHYSGVKELSDSQSEKDGRMFVEFEIFNSKFQDNLSEAANCILNK